MEVGCLDSSVTGLTKVRMLDVVMSASPGIVHVVMQPLVVESDAGGGYLDRICLQNL